MPVARDGDENLLAVARGKKLVDTPAHRLAHAAVVRATGSGVHAGHLGRRDVLADPEDDRIK